MIPSSRVRNQVDQPEAVQVLIDRAAVYLTTLPWCIAVQELYLCWGFAKFCLFLAQCKTRNGTEQNWVVVGDVPPAVLDLSFCPNGLEALEGYVGEFKAWVEAVESGGDINELMPVLHPVKFFKLPPTKETADWLDQRLNFIITEVITPFSEELIRNQYVRDDAGD